jgi:hypothetical protein
MTPQEEITEEYLTKEKGLRRYPFAESTFVTPNITVILDNKAAKVYKPISIKIKGKFLGKATTREQLDELLKEK